MLELPNVPDPSIPVGGKEANVVIGEEGQKPQFSFDPLDHKTLVLGPFVGSPKTVRRTVVPQSVITNALGVPSSRETTAKPFSAARARHI